MHMAVLAGPQLYPPQNGEPLGLSGCHSLLQAIDGVVVGERQHLHPGLFGFPNQLCGGVLSIGGGGVGM